MVDSRLYRLPALYFVLAYSPNGCQMMAQRNYSSSSGKYLLDSQDIYLSRSNTRSYHPPTHVWHTLRSKRKRWQGLLGTASHWGPKGASVASYSLSQNALSSLRLIYSNSSFMLLSMTSGLHDKENSLRTGGRIIHTAASPTKPHDRSGGACLPQRKGTAPYSDVALWPGQARHQS